MNDRANEAEFRAEMDRIQAAILDGAATRSASSRAAAAYRSAAPA